MSSLLIITPDYASHYYPLSAVASEMARRGHRVVFATGPGLGDRVRSDGFETVSLALGRGSNPGLIEVESQTPPEVSQLEALFEASRRGPVAALRHQAEHRLDDLLWEPLAVAARLEKILELEPDRILVDHLAYGATAALRGLGVDYSGFHPGHPSAISSDRPYGVPLRLPKVFADPGDELNDLEALCAAVADEFTRRYNAVIAELGSGDVVDDAFTSTGSASFINYPSSLGARYHLPLDTTLIGSSVRTEILGEALSRRLSMSSMRPRIYVSLGSFFSARSDLLRKMVTAFRREPVELILATGVTPVGELGDIPSGWIVAPHFPQPALLGSVDLVVTHGGNNTVTEALTAGVPLLVAPLSTDQFDGAADIVEAGLGAAIDPNRDASSAIADRAHEILSSDAPGRARAFGVSLRANPGQRVVADALEEQVPVVRSV